MAMSSSHLLGSSSNTLRGNSPKHHDEQMRSLGASKRPLNMESAEMDYSATVQQEGDEGDTASDALFKELFARSESQLEFIFGKKRKRKEYEDAQDDALEASGAIGGDAPDATQEIAPKKPARDIDEDDYDDDDDDEEDDTEKLSSAKSKTAGPLLSPSKSGSSPVHSDSFSTKQPSKESEKDGGSQTQPQNAEEVRKRLEEAKKATEDAVKRSFSTMIYTLESDRIAMLEQQRLEDSEKQIDADLDHGSHANAGANGESHGTLSSANLGASSLTLKHLIARIDIKRDRVKASDAELRSLMNEVRKNRSKWASEENVGQEELYESAEKVLSELKAMTEYSAPFLTRVNKREAPDYYNIIKTPMDLGTMTKKLKTLQYKSKAEFTADLELIWSNCLKYNADMAHPLRRNANSMRKEAEKLIPLIPDIIIRPRAEVEAEERRKQNGGDDADESDDEPIMSSRGRKAPGKTGAKSTSTKARKAITGREDTPNEQKPSLHLNGLLGMNEGSEFGREGSSNGFATPPIGGGSGTPGGSGIPGAGSQIDAMDIDGPSINGMTLGQALGVAAEDLREDEEYKIWKQVTKKDRALVAKERHKLFKGEKLNPDEPALLRTKAGMRRWLRQQKQAEDADGTSKDEAGDKPATRAPETLAEGMEGDDERVIPDYYDPLSAIPDIPSHLRWVEDDKGQVIDQAPEEMLRMVPKGLFTAPQSALTSRIEANMRQMQETRKICSKIGVVKQMQLQSQMYNNQFQKYNPEPFVEEDIEPHVVTDDGPIMSPWVCRAALQRSVGKLCYHAGFEELQPSALEVITDMAADYFQKIAQTFIVFREAPKVPATGLRAQAGQTWQDRYTNEEVLLHCLSENGMDVESLESYARDDNERLGTKLGVMHERMKAHLTELLRPALSGDAGADGVGAFNDGSEQFVGGDFAEDLGEDFFGFKELGLEKEFGLSSLSVPLHLLQSKVHNAHQANNATSGPTTSVLFEDLPRLEPVTVENIQDQIGLVKNFFLAKLHANGDEPLVEDEDLPTKQRFPKPRLPPTGKITSPRKRPLKEQQGNAKKKKKLENGQAMDVSPEKNKGSTVSPEKGKKLKVPPPDLGKPGMNGGPVGQPMQRDESQGGASTTEKDDGSAAGPLSPESIER